MELCTGGTLEHLIEQDGPLPEIIVRDFGTNIVAGLHYLHSLGIVHCDLTPYAIVLDSDDSKVIEGFDILIRYYMK